LLPALPSVRHSIGHPATFIRDPSSTGRERRPRAPQKNRFPGPPSPRPPERVPYHLTGQRRRVPGPLRRRQGREQAAREGLSGPHPTPLIKLCKAAAWHRTRLTKAYPPKPNGFVENASLGASPRKAIGRGAKKKRAGQRRRTIHLWSRRSGLLPSKGFVSTIHRTRLTIASATRLPLTASSLKLPWTNTVRRDP